MQYDPSDAKLYLSSNDAPEEQCLLVFLICNLLLQPDLIADPLVKID